MRCFEEKLLKKKMFFKIVSFITIFTIFKVHFSKSNDAGPVSFDRLDFQIEKIKPSQESEWIEECKCVPLVDCVSEESDATVDIRIITKPDKCPFGKVYCCSDPWMENPLLLCGKVTAQDIDGIKIRPDQAKFGEFPWQALILTNGNSFVSNGVLIDNKHIVSTAHFLTSFVKTSAEFALETFFDPANGADVTANVVPANRITRPLYHRNASAIKVRLGEWDIYRNVEPQPHVERPVARVVVHPEYSAANMYNDVAVITLSETVTANGYIRPACMPSPGASWTGCRVSGWGTESFERPRYPGVLKKADVPLWDRERCAQRLRTTRLGAKFQLHEGFLCAGGEEHEDACKGDGGSPLVCERDSVAHLVGLVSWGIGCGTASVPGVYTDVSVYVTWIEKQMHSEAKVKRQARAALGYATFNRI